MLRGNRANIILLLVFVSEQIVRLPLLLLELFVSLDLVGGEISACLELVVALAAFVIHAIDVTGLDVIEHVGLALQTLLTNAAEM